MTEIGRDCAGAFQFCPASQVDSINDRASGEIVQSEEQIADKIRQLKQDFGAWQQDSIDGPYPFANAFSLAGGQPKTALRYKNSKWSLPYGNEPTTHIIKPSVRDNYPDLDIVEHLTQATARRLGLAAARTECVDVGGERTLLVHRYDRITAQGITRRVHQEDMCQAFGTWPHAKYQHYGGPSPGGIVDLLRQVSESPADDITQFRNALLFNWLFVGTDGHAKNYSLLLEGASVRLAPLYDVISFLPYAKEHPISPQVKLSMSAGQDYSLGAADQREYWELMSSHLDLPATDTLDAAHRMVSQAPDALAAEINLLSAEHQSSDVVDAFDQRLIERAGQCQAVCGPTGNRGG